MSFSRGSTTGDFEESCWSETRVSLPTLIDPVGWRETTKTSFGSFRYLLRVLLVIETPVFAICALLAAAEESIHPIVGIMIVLWIICTLIVCVKATSLVTGERSRETLDVLLTTPLRSNDIIHQKFRGVTRLMLVLSVPLLTPVLFKTWILSSTRAYYVLGYRHDESWALYLLCSLLSVAIYLPIVAWLSLLIGIRVRTQNKAIFTTLAIIVAWCALPMFVTIALVDMPRFGSQETAASLLLLLSPASIIPLNEGLALERVSPSAAVAVMLNFGMYSFMLFGLRALALNNLDRNLGRAECEVT